MKKYDTIVILGSRPKNPETWELPTHIYKSLDRAIELYRQKHTNHITVSGKWTINFDVLHIAQPFSECDAMADYLLEKGIPGSAILRETESKDVISNLFYLKRQILQPGNLKSLLFIAAEARLARIAYLCQRILGPEYTCAFEGVAYDPEDVSPNEARTLKKQSDFLAPMRDGDEAWLEGKFYDDPYYRRVKARVIERAALEPFLHLADPPFTQE